MTTVGATVGFCHRAVEDLETCLAGCGSEIDQVDVDTFDADALDRAISAVRRLQSRLDAAVVRLGRRADDLAATGSGPPARDALLGTGQVRGVTARREAARAALAARAPDLGRAMGGGRLGPDHLDALVRRLAPLGDGHLARVVVDGVVDRAAGLPADTYDRSLRRVIDATAQPDEAGADDDSRARSELSWSGSTTGPAWAISPAASIPNDSKWSPAPSSNG